MKIEGYQNAIWLTFNKLGKSRRFLVITLAMKNEQQPLYGLNHTGEGCKPLRVIIDNTMNNLTEEKHGEILEVR